MSRDKALKIPKMKQMRMAGIRLMHRKVRVVIEINSVYLGIVAD